MEKNEDHHWIPREKSYENSPVLVSLNFCTASSVIRKYRTLNWIQHLIDLTNEQWAGNGISNIALPTTIICGSHLFVDSDEKKILRKDRLQGGNCETDQFQQDVSLIAYLVRRTYEYIEHRAYFILVGEWEWVKVNMKLLLNSFLVASSIGACLYCCASYNRRMR